MKVIPNVEDERTFTGLNGGDYVEYEHYINMVQFAQYAEKQINEQEEVISIKEKQADKALSYIRELQQEIKELEETERKLLA